jgi:protein SCO1/2
MNGPAMTGTAAPIAGTMTACAAVLLLFAWAVLMLTGNLEAWTFEDKRREDARHGLLHAPTTEVRTSQGTLQTLWPKPTDGHSVSLVNFIYTSCPTVCQTLGAEYTQMQQALLTQAPGHPHPIQLVSLSFDVAHDDTRQLAAYARLHAADAEAWTIAAPVTVAGTTELLHDLGIVAIPDGMGGYVHNGSIHLLDSAGTVLAIYDDADWQQALAMALRYSGGTQ